tara:strand:+ start:264 stop:455 length:192 start_codon:yes stop_codon:yes gene_type:complete
MNTYIRIENAQYRKVFPDDSAPVEIRATVDGEVVSIPVDTNNRHYVEAMRQVAAGLLTIADAD